ncbi:hypothetical protein [Streptomyces sp. NPDC057557]|uniref:hypothetical protein n=1 Tax=Streptomyces sp. NPDC057557 TaxID=3346167 RepID=UPI0036CAC5EB
MPHSTTRRSSAFASDPSDLGALGDLRHGALGPELLEDLERDGEDPLVVAACVGHGSVVPGRLWSRLHRIHPFIPPAVDLCQGSD